MEQHDPLATPQPGTGQPNARQRMLADLEQTLSDLRASAKGAKGSEESETSAAPEEAGADEHETEAPEQQAGQAGPEESQSEPAPEAQEENIPESEGSGEEREAQTEEEEAGQEPQETVALFDGSPESKEKWRLVGSGALDLRDSELHLRAGNDRGLAYYPGQRFGDFRLKVRYRLGKPDAPVSAAVRFRNPLEPVPGREDPNKKQHYDNPAYVAAHTGFEVRLGSGLGGDPGTLVGIPVGDGPDAQRHGHSGELTTEDWNELELEVRGEEYAVRLNGTETSRYTNADAWRGKAATEPQAGFIGIVLGEQPRARRAPPGPQARPPSGSPSVPGLGAAKRATHAAAGAVGRMTGGPAADLVVQRIEVGLLSPAPETHEEQEKGARKDLEALHEEVRGTLARLKAKDKGIEGLLKESYGYAVVPAVGRASLLLGGARGYGEVFEHGKPIGFTRVTQLTFGVQVGGQSFSQLIVFGSKESLEAFKRSPLGFSGNLSAVFIKGATGMANFKDVTAHAYSRGGMLLEASLGGQKYRFLKEDEAIQELAKRRENQGAKAKLMQAGHAAKGLAGKVSAKAAKLFHHSKSGERNNEQKSESQ